MFGRITCCIFTSLSLPVCLCLSVSLSPSLPPSLPPSLSLPPSSPVTDGGRYTLSTGRDVVSLTVSNVGRNDTGDWNCTVQVFENVTTGLVVGEPVERLVTLVVVGKFITTCIFYTILCLYSMYVS